MSADDDRLHAELSLLRNMRFAEMDPDAYQQWQDKVDDIGDQYQKARAIEKSDKSTAEQKKYAKDLGDTIAKGLPAMAKGLQAAIVAFNKGDAITGSAAIMDICAAAAPMIALMCIAAGPEGMLVGAVFSVIGQIIAIFTPKQPSLKDQIQEMLRDLNAETQLQSIEAVHLSNEVRDVMLTTIYRDLAEHTNLSLLVRAGEREAFDAGGSLDGKTIVAVRGSVAAAQVKLRYPGSTIRFVDEVARDQQNALGYVAGTLIAGGQADALYGLDLRNRALRDDRTGLAVADVHMAPGRKPSILELPLLTEDDADRFDARLEALIISVQRVQAKSDIAEFTNWQVAAWLKMKEKQKYPRWPEVLTLWCRVYSDRISSNIKFNCLIDPELLREKVVYTHERDGGCPLPPLRKAKIHGFLTTLQALATVLRTESAACNEVALKVLQDIMPAVRNWGLFAFLRTDHGLYFSGGPDPSRDWVDRSDRNYYHRLSLSTGRAPLDGGTGARYDLKPKYDCLLLKSDSNQYPGTHAWLDRLHVRSNDFDIQDTTLIRDKPQFLDVCATQGMAGLECWAIPGGHDGIETWSLDKANQFKQVDWVKIDQSPVDHVRALYPTQDSLIAADPDAAAIEAGSAWFDPRQDGYAALIYGGLRDRGNIYVNALKAGYYVPSPWPSYAGIAVDDRHVWVFRAETIACATHASVIACLQKKRAAPQWMQHRLQSKMLGCLLTDFRARPVKPDEHPIDSGYGHEHYWCIDLAPAVRPMPPLKGLISMSPCADGTILASVVYREAFCETREYADPRPIRWQAKDGPKVYSTSYSIDWAKQTIRIDDTWVEFDSPGLQVQKLPIPCWPLLSSLNTRLEMR